MQVLSDGRIRRTAPEWKENIDRFGRSGLPIAAFCEKGEISRSAFASWKKKPGAVTNQAAGFVEIKSATNQVSPAPTAERPATSFESALPGGATPRWRI
jgi:hypothetical protein